MTATAAPFGLQPTRNGINGRATGDEAYTIATAYATSIFNLDPIALDPAGTGNLTIGVNAAHLFGVFHGCEYTSSDNYYRVRPMWTASQALLSGTTCLAYITRDPFTEYFVQANGSVAMTAIGFGGDVVMGAGTALNGQSTTALNSSLGSGTTTKQCRIVGLAGLQNNAWGDAFTILRVILNNLSGFLPMGGVTSWV